ncbi:3-oxosteroid 1-dehydrogenase [Putridiphycobacter roseus]|uniref:3-oxosteroid 1-dehydrogenase n=1 Tax=Putridiphycobacter roseus TaxID=2219161 RepID=A0A2W1NJ70_9FLAO|nr:FAD-binding protein [Putridiphycobacter roseus]PZE15672.1 3-oxosteroid 1-dehydrogenase [Putridiphycobacter roseus]
MKQIQTDFLIVGSGSGGMTAAITAHELGMNTIVVEKSPYYGGSSAMSGGAVWAPNNPVLKRNGITDSVEDIVTYMKAITNNEVEESKIVMYAEQGQVLFEMLEKKSGFMKFSYCNGYSDYHPEAPKGRPEGRSIEADPFNLNELKEDKALLHPTDIAVPKGVFLTGKEFNEMAMMMRTWKGFTRVMKLSVRTVGNLIRGKDTTALGLALMGRLRMVLKENKIPLWLNSPLEELIYVDHKVVGAIVNKGGEKVQINASKGVLLAMGGFDHNKLLRKTYLPTIAQDVFSSGAIENLGDAVAIVEKLDAKLELMDEAWWMPAVQLPNKTMFPLVSERAIPRSIIVGGDGKRFTNESSPYVTFVHDQIKAGWKTVWQILDKKAVNRYMYAGKPPGVPFSKLWYKEGIVFKANTIQELAEKINIDATSLGHTVAEFNEMVKKGKDELFQRGDSAYDKYYGDPTLTNPVLDHLNKGPYYAVKLRIGDLGTKGGIKANEYGQGLNTKGAVINGLYATGNVAASVMGRDYAGAGGTIGPAMIFGYVAAKHANGWEK